MSSIDDPTLRRHILEFLRASYGDVMHYVEPEELSGAIGVDDHKLDIALRYLSEENMITGLSDISITTKGIRYLERLENEDKAKNSTLNQNKDSEIVSRLNFFKEEYIRLKNTESDEEEHQVSNNFSLLMRKISLSEADRISLENNVTYLHNLVFHLLANRINYPDIEETSKSRSAINDAYDKVINAIDFTIRNPHPLRYRKIEPKQKSTFFTNLLKLEAQNRQKISKLIKSEKPLELPLLKEDFPDGLRVFISHKFINGDQKLAVTLQQLLLNNQINGYLAERKREYELPISEKIQNEILRSDYLVAILTKESVKSASVNQEIGYALGVKVPVIVMAEKDLLTGVLTHGREPEEFTYEKFEQPCKNILEYIKKNGKRKKISDDDKKLLIDNVYRPCFNQMMNEYNMRDFIIHIPTNKWRDLEPYWRLQTESDMVEIFEEYEKQIAVWHRMWVDFENKFQSTRDHLGEVIRPIFAKFNLLDQQGYIQFGKSTHTPKDWLQNCHNVIFDVNIKSGEELYNILRNYLRTRWGVEYAESLDDWNKKIPEIYSELVNTIPELVQELDTKYSYQQRDEQRQILKKTIELLTDALKEKLRSR